VKRILQPDVKGAEVDLGGGRKDLLLFASEEGSKIEYGKIETDGGRCAVGKNRDEIEWFALHAGTELRLGEKVLLKAGSTLSAVLKLSKGAISVSVLTKDATEVSVLCPFKPQAITLNKSVFKDYRYDSKKYLLHLKLPSAGTHSVRVRLTLAQNREVKEANQLREFTHVKLASVLAIALILGTMLLLAYNRLAKSETQRGGAQRR